MTSMPAVRVSLAGLAVVLVSGCGTLAGTHEIVNVPAAQDTSVRVDGELVFTAPKIIRVHRQRHHDITVLDAQTQEAKASETATCSFRWLTSGICNGVLAIGSPVIGLAALGIDLATGAAFDCHGTLPVPSTATPANSQGIAQPEYARCPKFLIAPPGQADPAVAVQMVRSWREHKELQPGFCGSFVDDERSLDMFNYLNISSRNAAEFSSLSRAQANSLGYESGADKLVVLSQALNAEKPLLDAQIIDLHTLERAVDSTVVLDKTEAESLRQMKQGSWLLYSFSLIPNAIVYSGSVVAPQLHDFSGARVTSHEQRHSRFMSVVGGLSLTSVDHPMGFNEWDSALRFFPSIEFNHMDFETRRLSAAGELGEQRRFETLTAYAPYNIGLSEFTPYGTLGLSGGIGPMLAWMYADRPTQAVYWPTNAELSWTYFTSRDVFFGVSVTEYHTDRPLDIHGTHCTNWSEVALSVGYFTSVFHRMANAVRDRTIAQQN